MTKKIIKFKNFIHLDESELLFVLEKRNSDEIRNKMTNTDIISVEDHLKFCNSLKNDSTRLYYLIYLDDEPVGVADFQDINNENHTYEPGMYFFSEQSNQRTYITYALGYIRCMYKLYYPFIRVRKDNPQALFFNTMKMGAKLEREDEDFYYLSEEKIPEKDFETVIRNSPSIQNLNEKYEVVIE